jgi:hypothetical protein
VPFSRSAMTSPSSTTSRAGIARAAVTTSGTAGVTSRRFRVYTFTSSPTLWTWNARAVQFVFERRLAQRLERAAHIACGVGQHRLHRLEWLQHEPRKRVLAIHERCPRHRREIAGQHRRPADTGAAMPEAFAIASIRTPS